MARSIRAAKFLTVRLLANRLRDSRAILGAMCCGVSELRKRILGCSANFTSAKRWRSVSELRSPFKPCGFSASLGIPAHLGKEHRDGKEAPAAHGRACNGLAHRRS